MILTNEDINKPDVVGRLGNQMFVIASIIGLARDYGIDFSFPEWNYSSQFGIDHELNSGILRSGKYYNYTEKCHGYDDDIGYEILYAKEWGYSVFKLCGYLQDKIYFDHHRDLIQWLFNDEDHQTDHGVCSIHVRRGDYLKFPHHHPVCSMKYYRDAMNEINTVSNDIRFRVFSDDIGWCKENFRGDEFEFIEGNDEVTDIKLMSQCEHNIIANSSFSWWGAYLNTNPHKMVVKPFQWFGDALRRYNTDGYRVDGWTTL